MTRPTVRRKWSSRNARIKQESLKRSKIAIKTGFLTRTHGTEKQIGQKFPVGNKLPVKSRPRASTAYPGISTKKLARQEAKKLPFDGFTAVIRYKDGSVKTIPIAAKSYEDFLDKLKSRIKDIDTKQVAEVSIAGGGKFLESLGSALHKVGSGARGFFEGIKTGTGNWAKSDTPKSIAQAIGRRLGTQAREFAGSLPSKLETSALKASKTVGHIAGTPRRLKEAYKEGYGEAPEPEKVEKAPVKEWGERAAKPFLKFANMEDRPRPGDRVLKPGWREEYVSQELQSKPVKERISRLIKRRSQTLGVAPFLRRKHAADIEKLTEMYSEVDAIEKTMSGGELTSAGHVRLNARLSEIKREVGRMGGKRRLKRRRK
jgi:hypothetical protein